MAVVSLKGLWLTNRDGTPEKATSSYLSGGLVRGAAGFLTIGAADTVASKYFFVSLPSNARVIQVLLSQQQTIGADTACTLDLWDVPTVNNGAVVKTGFFNGDIDLNASQNKLADVSHTSSGANTYIYGSSDEQRIWEVLGLASDPNKFYDVIMVSTVNNSSTGSDVSLNVLYTL